VQGEAWTLHSEIREQLFLIGREAVMNALRHARATRIEVEVRYRGDLLRLCVRDNGCGFTSEAIRKAGDSHPGLRGMQKRAATLGADLGIWSRSGAGTEVRLALRAGK
jgi:signal transduction histidine kinase